MTTKPDGAAAAVLCFRKIFARTWTMSDHRFDAAAALQLATVAVNEERFERGAIRRLYAAADSPLVRDAAAA